LRLRSDVPVGACLSGGLDSSAIVALVNEITPQKFKSFSVVYPGTLEDESPYVEELAARCRNLERYVATPDGTDLFEVLRRRVWHFEEPAWGPAVYSWWHVMRLARSEGVTVLLNGQGSDELLAGYPLYYPTYLRQLLVSGRWGRFIRETRQQARKDGVSFLG